MRKTTYVPFDEDREEQKIEEKAERRRLRSEPCNDNEEEFDPERFGKLNPRDAEFSSVEEFVEFLADDDENTFTHEHLACLEFNLDKAVWHIRKELEGYGLTLARRRVEKSPRTFSTNPHNRWTEPC